MSGMFGNSNMTCPYLLGSAEGAICGIEKKLIRHMVNADIWFCLGRKYEACSRLFRVADNDGGETVHGVQRVIMDDNCKEGIKEP